LPGNIYAQQHQLAPAISYYEEAVYMVPNRFVSRKKLADLYEAAGQTGKACFWYQSVLLLLVKVPSDIVDQVKMETISAINQVCR
jgi:hypothetical protein